MRREDPEATFEVIVVDSAPLHEGTSTFHHFSWAKNADMSGLALLKALTAHKIPTTYTLLSTLSPLLQRSSIVLLGASALYANGSLHSRAGTAMVAMLAKEYRVPVVVAVETYKFTDGTRLDALGSNEVDLNWMDGGNGVIADEEGKEKDDVNLTKLSLCYDLTAAEYITVLCTEVSYSFGHDDTP
jgi:translation initiation factor eIF-2B subunit delta